MNREETRRAAEVMLAFADGAELLRNRRGDSRKEGYAPGETPAWDWCNFEYHVKTKPPQKRIRPWTYDEIVARMAERPLLVCYKGDSGRCFLVLSAGPEGANIGAVGVHSLRYLSEQFTQQDKTQCGVIE